MALYKCCIIIIIKQLLTSHKQVRNRFLTNHLQLFCSKLVADKIDKMEFGLYTASYNIRNTIQYNTVQGTSCRLLITTVSQSGKMNETISCSLLVNLYRL